MNKVPVTKIRNFTIAGHAGSGKTSLADLMLFKSGKVSRLGKVNDRNSNSDYRPDEQDKLHSLYATPLTCEWNGHTLFFIDTPGFADYLGEALSSLSICDTALITVNANEGIENGTTRASKIAQKRKLPRAFFINGLDREHSDFDRVLDSLQKAYGKTTCVPFTIPVGKAQNLSKVVHVLRSEEIPAEIKDQVEKYKSDLMDTVAEADEELMMRYLDGEELTEEEISTGLHNAIHSCNLIPVFAGSVERDIGVAELMNGIVNLFSNPLMQKTMPLQEGELDITADGNGIAFVFKTVVDPFTGQLSFFRVYSGNINSDTDIYNVSQNVKERIGHLLVINGKEQTSITEAGPGYIVAVSKMKSTKISDTLAAGPTDKKFPPIIFPNPNMSYACYAINRGEEDKIATGLHRLADEDPTVRLERQPETHEMLLSGMGDQHLKVIVNRLKSNFKVDIDLRTPKIPYRETITKIADGKYRHKKQSGGHGQFAEVWLRLEPLADDDFEFVSEVVGGNIPKNYIPSVEKGVKDAMLNGPIAGCRVINIKAVVFDGKHHPVDSSDIAFQIAGRSAFRETMRNANPILLEPIMKMSVRVPDQYMGDISGDLNQRRGRIQGMGLDEGMQVVHAEAPLAELHTYSTQLRSITQGKGTFDMEFAHYEQVPGNIAKQIQEAADHKDHEEH